MNDEFDDTAGTALALFVLLIAGIALFLLAMLVPAPASDVCLTKKQARHLWPRSHIYWYSADHCWSNRHGPPRHIKIDPEDKPPKKIKGDPIFSPKAEAVDPADVNALDALAQEKPLPMFPELSAKIEALMQQWQHRWDAK